MSTATRALVRAIPATFADAITMRAPPADAQRIDVGVARQQHERYVDTLARAGLEIVRLPADDTLPDCCFVEDCALVADGIALITRPGAESRRGEVHAVRAALEERLRLEVMTGDATLDGGDCMRVGLRIFVGRSARTNEAGIARVREVFAGYEVVPLSLGEILHLKCVVSPLGDDLILLAEGTIPPAMFGDVRVVSVPMSETFAANAVAVGHKVIAAANHPATEAALSRAGFEVLTVDTSEIRKADGSLTCLSLLF